MQKTYCLETSFLIDFLRGEEPALKKYDEIKNDRLETTSIVAWEILRGPKLIGRTKEYEDAVRLLSRLRVAPFTITSARIASEIERNLREKGENVNIIDVLIAAVAIEGDSTLITRDEGYRRIHSLNVEFY